MIGGLTGEQGVLIPAQNRPDLMLKEDVVAAVAAGKFHIYAVSTIDEGIEILTGVAAGMRGDDGTYPSGSINRLVEDRLAELAETWRRYLTPHRGAGADA
jgi:predicted ATP-dependent protease